MYRLPYEFVIAEAEKLLDKVIHAVHWEVCRHLENYFTFITKCGWTDWELNQEMLRHIDATWDLIIRNQNKIRRIRTALS